MVDRVPCRLCGVEKSEGEFAIDRSKKSGRKSACKRCEADRAVARYHGNDWALPPRFCIECGVELSGHLLRKFCSKSCGRKNWVRAHPEYREREAKRTAERDAARVASGAEGRRMIARRAKAAGMTPEEFVAEKARVARARSAQRNYRQHSRLRKVVNRERVAELARETQRRLILAKYHADPDNWSSRKKRRRIFERDGWKCRTCGKAVTDQVGAKDANRAVAGHIVAAAKGGGWTDENIATLCYPCNMADGVERIPIQAHLAW